MNQVKNYDGRIFITADGQLIDTKTNKAIKPSRDSSGALWFWSFGYSKTVRLRHALWDAFGGAKMEKGDSLRLKPLHEKHEHVDTIYKQAEYRESTLYRIDLRDHKTQRFDTVLDATLATEDMDLPNFTMLRVVNNLKGTEPQVKGYHFVLSEDYNHDFVAGRTSDPLLDMRPVVLLNHDATVLRTFDRVPMCADQLNIHLKELRNYLKGHIFSGARIGGYWVAYRSRRAKVEVLPQTSPN